MLHAHSRSSLHPLECRWKLPSNMSKHFKLAQICLTFSFLFLLVAELTNPTKTWRKTWIQRSRSRWSTRQMFQHPQHCRSSSSWRCRRMSRNKRAIATTLRKPPNQDCVSCFRCFCSSSRSQQFSACWSSTWIHQVSWIIIFASITSPLNGQRRPSSALRFAVDEIN